jgi:peptidoglycan/LPS O-acetylase OafA/YrhL
MYKGIEGLRAWLAWTVVCSHIADVGPSISINNEIADAGDFSVRIFIVISGFVITHLIQEKKEHFPVFIARRFLRIYPAYLVALIFAILVSPLRFQAVLGDPYADYLLRHCALVERAQYDGNLMSHLLAHLTLLHGALPHNILPASEFMFLAPAWSLSLEWQFYLIAPIWIWALCRFPLTIVSLTFLGFLAYNFLLASMFYSPSFLSGAGLLFLLGMMTRFWLPSASRPKNYPWFALIGFFGVVFFYKDLVVLWVWLATVAYLLQDKKWAALDGPIAQAAGRRSYAVYIVHYPVLSVVLFVTSARLHLTGAALLTSLTVLTIAGTLALSEFIHRWIERPGIRFGEWIGLRTEQWGRARIQQT